jgi:hypothetical protein|eukprot:3424202-Prymnesium_polylepis.1
MLWAAQATAGGGGSTQALWRDILWVAQATAGAFGGEHAGALARHVVGGSSYRRGLWGRFVPLGCLGGGGGCRIAAVRVACGRAAVRMLQPPYSVPLRATGTVESRA